MQNTEKTLNANTQVEGRLEWIPLISPKQSLALTLTSLQTQIKKSKWFA